MRRHCAGVSWGIAWGVIGAAVVAGTLAGFAGCEKETGQTTGAAQAEMGPPAQEYTVRGKVASLPDPAKPTSVFRVHHEAIDNFVDGDGKVVGMGAMEMPFPLAEGVTLDHVQVGDVVEVDFAVWWKPRRHYEATRVEKLPAETPLEFRPVRPAQPEGDAEKENAAETGDAGASGGE